MAAKGVPRDPTCTHEAVQIVRDAFRFCPNIGYRKDMIICGEANMKLWKEVVKEFSTPYWKDGKQKRRSPLAWGKLLAEFDRRYADNVR